MDYSEQGQYQSKSKVMGKGTCVNEHNNDRSGEHYLQGKKYCVTQGGQQYEGKHMRASTSAQANKNMIAGVHMHPR